MSSSEETDSPLGSSPPASTKKRTQTQTISPPPLKRKRQQPPDSSTATTAPTSLSLSAAIEAGQIQITDHLTHFTHLLSRHTLSPYPPCTPHLPISDYASLFSSAHLNPSGAHFVIHQHDHPIAGTHYDLRLQINGTSSASWAIMKGLPGEPNSKRIGRNATETRVHCLWNHLVESGSAATGSLVVWDTGGYEVLPRRQRVETDEEGSQARDGGEMVVTEQEKLARGFGERRIRLRLHGARLPRGYTVYLRLSLGDDVEGRAKAGRGVEGGRRRRSVRPLRKGGDGLQTDSEGEEYSVAAPQTAPDDGSLSAVDKELRELEDGTVRRTNAYPGAENTIGSVHQRRWFLSLDRPGSGFVKRKVDGKSRWVMDGSKPHKDEDGNRLKWPFYVRGSEFERSVVTSRLGSEVLRDEGVTDFRGRKGWRAILD